MSGFIYGAVAALNSIFSTPDAAAMNDISTMYTDTLKADTTLFYRMGDDMGHEGVVTEITYRDTSAWDDGEIYTRAMEDFQNASGLKGHMPALRKAILEDVENPDGTHTAKVLYFFRRGYPRYDPSDKKDFDRFMKKLPPLKER